MIKAMGSWSRSWGPHQGHGVITEARGIPFLRPWGHDQGHGDPNKAMVTLIRLWDHHQGHGDPIIKARSPSPQDHSNGDTKGGETPCRKDGGHQRQDPPAVRTSGPPCHGDIGTPVPQLQQPQGSTEQTRGGFLGVPSAAAPPRPARPR